MNFVGAVTTDLLYAVFTYEALFTGEYIKRLMINPSGTGVVVDKTVKLGFSLEIMVKMCLFKLFYELRYYCLKSLKNIGV